MANDPVPYLRPTLLAMGDRDAAIRRRWRSSEWTRVRGGAYVPEGEWASLGNEERHRLLVTATAPKLDAQSVVSHVSAAVMHGLPIVGAIPTTVHITRQSSSGGFRRGQLHSHVGHLESADVVIVGKIPVTSVLRTVFDCARTLSLESALTIADAALHTGQIDKEALGELVSRQTRLHGRVQALRIAALADGRSESPGESISRLHLAAAGLPRPELQYEIRDGGLLVARVDFCWPEFRTVGEFDGRVKYGRFLKPGDDAAAIVHREKVREDAVRDLRWQMVRWGWIDFPRFDPVVVHRLQRAFTRGVAA